VAARAGIELRRRLIVSRKTVPLPYRPGDALFQRTAKPESGENRF